MRQGLNAQFELVQTLGDLSNQATIHTFCSTDLVTGLPLTFSSPGLVRRMVPGGKEGDRVLVVEEPGWRLAAVVQASAAFPGLAPMRIKLPDDPQAPSHWAWCADGGIWNNLGTQGIEGDPRVPDLSVLCVNASAGAKPMRVWWCFVPGVSSVAAVARSVNILNLNTVAPRIEAIDRGVSRWAENQAAGGPAAPFTIVADMRPIAEAVELLFALPVDVGVQNLVATPWWIDLTARDRPDYIRTKTKLSKVKEKEVLALLLRGYANAWLASLTIQPFEASDLDDQHVRDISARLDVILAGT